MEFDNIGYAFILTLLAGLATGIGSLIAYSARKTNLSFLSFSLGLSVGVMIYISFMELLPSAESLLIESYGSKLGQTYNVIGLFAGIVLIAIIDFLVPSYENPHEPRNLQDKSVVNEMKIKRLGVMAALAIAIHNFPEGISTFVTVLESPSLGLAIAIAIALHNIPEGIAISIPIFYSTGSRQKAFWFSLLSGLAEPLGALLAYLFLMPFITEQFMGIMLAMVAGIMIYVSIDELLPAAREYGKHHYSIIGVVVGMAIMAISLIML